MPPARPQMELAHALANGPVRRSVLFVCYGSEETGELGSTYFGEHPPVPLKDLVANPEFEMIAIRTKMAKGVLLSHGMGPFEPGSSMKEHGALLGCDPIRSSTSLSSDNYALALKGVVAHTCGLRELRPLSPAGRRPAASGPPVHDGGDPVAGRAGPLACR
jgi:hypothetical protein